MTPVLDASVFVAAISPDETHHRQALRLFDRHPEPAPFLVPELFRLEVVAGLARRGEQSDLVDAVDAVIRGPRFVVCSLDGELLEHAVTVARRARLRAYDAVYVALALLRKQPIVTLDREIVERSKSHFASLRVFGAA